MPSDAWKEIATRMAELRDLGAVAALLGWDQETHMPPGGAQARAWQLGALHAILHERISDPRLGELLDEVEVAHDVAGDDDRRAMVRNLRRDRDRAVRVPAALVREYTERRAVSAEVWRRARQEDDFASFRPHLEALLELKKQQADALGHDGERYDALLEHHEPGMRVARLEPIFGRLEAALVPIVDALAAATPPAAWQPDGHSFPADAQWTLGLHALRSIGFDLERGRLDRSTHPFSEGISPGDVRLTTAVDERNPLRALYANLHEGGHGLYEQNLPADHQRDFLGRAASVGLHESQSRFWENMVGRSRGFCQRLLPELSRLFPEAFAGTTVAELHARVNQVERSLIRVEADEVTYNLHILIRFRLELAMLRGDLAVADLPGAWNDAMAATVGIRPPNDRLGVLQDMHWAFCELAYFPTYTIGNLYAAILFQRIDQDLGGADEVIAAGDLHRIRDWLTDRIHAQGHRHDAEELVGRAAGTGLDERPFLAYLRAKYGQLYGVSL